jgi:hypothetical protein
MRNGELEMRNGGANPSGISTAVPHSQGNRLRNEYVSFLPECPTECIVQILRFAQDDIGALSS